VQSEGEQHDSAQTCSNESCLQAALRTGPDRHSNNRHKGGSKPNRGAANQESCNGPPTDPTHSHPPARFTTLNSSSKYLTSRTKAYYVSNVQCNTTQLLEGPGSVIVCVTYYIASLDNSIVKIMSCTQHTNNSKINNIITHNKYSKHLLKKNKKIYKHFHALEIHAYTSLHKPIINIDIRRLIICITCSSFLKVMLHSVPQIKLWRGEDLEVIREKRPTSKHLLKLTKNSSCLKNQMLTLQIHKIDSHIKMNKVDTHKCMSSYKYNRINWNGSYKNPYEVPVPNPFTKNII
jgi:hypothetical protein